MGNMFFYGRLADVQFQPDLLIAQPFAHLYRDLSLPSGKSQFEKTPESFLRRPCLLRFLLPSRIPLFFLITAQRDPNTDSLQEGTHI